MQWTPLWSRSPQPHTPVLAYCTDGGPAARYALRRCVIAMRIGDSANWNVHVPHFNETLRINAGISHWASLPLLHALAGATDSRDGWVDFKQTSPETDQCVALRYGTALAAGAAFSIGVATDTFTEFVLMDARGRSYRVKPQGLTHWTTLPHPPQTERPILSLSRKVRSP